MSTARRYFLRQYSNEHYRHGGIGYTDMETILGSEGYTAVQLPAVRIPVLSFLVRLVAIGKRWIVAKRCDEWVFIYPVYGRMNRWLLRALLWKRVKVTGIVGDIDGLKDEDAVLLKKDIRFLCALPAVILHNAAMETWLRSVGYSGKIATITLFDFLARPSQRPRTLSHTVVFAGNLAKSPFLYQLDQPAFSGLQFNVYGSGNDDNREWPVLVKHKGAWSPYELPEMLEGSFGLIWDGERWDMPAGSIGRYMQYISHHKLSLYILAGLPVVVPRIAGSAAFVEANNLGIVVENMADLEQEIKKLSEESYFIIRNNLWHWASRISQGYQLREALAALRV